MAMIKCPECKKKVSHEATLCPGCGFPIASLPPPKQKTSLGKGCLAFFLMFCFLFVAYAMLTKNNKSSEENKGVMKVSRLLSMSDVELAGYKRKTLLLGGVAGSKRVDSLGSFLEVLPVKEQRGKILRCYFPKTRLPQLQSVKTGQVVMVKGVFAGKRGDLFLAGCWLLSSV